MTPCPSGPTESSPSRGSWAGLGAVAVPVVDGRRADDQLVADGVAVAEHEADLGAGLDDEVVRLEAGVLDVDDDGDRLGAEGVDRGVSDVAATTT